MGIGVDRGRAGTHALQAHRLPHQHILVVRAGADDDQVARGGRVDRQLQRIAGRVLAIDVARRLAGHGDCDRVDRALAARGRDDQLAAAIGAHAGGENSTIRPTLRRGLAGRYGARCAVVAGGTDTGCRVQVGRNGRHRAHQLGVGPRTAVGRDTGDRDRASTAKPIVPGNGLLIERCGRRARAGEGRVRNHLGARVGRIVVTQAADGQRLTRSANPGSRATTTGGAGHGGHGWRQIRVLAVGQVIAVGEGLGRDHRRIHVLGLARHERRLVTEVAIRRAVGGIGDLLGEVGRCHEGAGGVHVASRYRVGPRDRARIVHARDHHLRHVTGRVRRVDAIGREVKTVEDAPLVGIHAGDFPAGKVAHANRQVRRRELLAKLRRERVEFRREVIGHRAGEMAGHVRRGEHVELRQCRVLVFQRHFLAIAQVAHGAREGRILARGRVQTVPIRHLALDADAGPEGLDAAGVTFVTRHGPEAVGQIQRARVVAVVGRAHLRLVRHDEDVAKAGELGGDRRHIYVAQQNVLVLFLHQLHAGRHDDFDHILAGAQHRRAVSWICDAVRAVRRGRQAGSRIDRGHARELVLTVVGRRLYLVQHRPAVKALELSVVRQWHAGVEPLRAALQGLEEWAGRILPRAVHVGRASSPATAAKTLRPVIPAAGRRGIHESQGARDAIGRRELLIQVELHARHTRLPAELQQQLRVVKGPRRGVDHVAFDAAVLSSGKGFHGELDEAVLAEQPLPAFRAVAGRIDTTRGEAGAASDAVARRTGGVRAVARARYPQGGRERVVFDTVRQAIRDAVRSGATEGVGGTAGVIDDVRAG